jgi:lipoic acid synthetase
MTRLPVWLNQEIPSEETSRLSAMLRESGVHTVCQEAHCPNMTECFSKSKLTFMILGDTCTRSCTFCAVKNKSRQGAAIDPQTPKRIAALVKQLDLKYVVITSVGRDDLIDGGASIFAETIKNIRSHNGSVRIEALIPDFLEKDGALQVVITARPDVIAHNLETVKRLYPQIKPKAEYDFSLQVLGRVKILDRSIITKSSLTLGMGETEEEIFQAMKDLRRYGCNCLTLGQYLAPSKDHYPVKQFITPAQFEIYRLQGLGMGFTNVFAGPKVRSSYMAEELLREITGE